MSLPDAIPSPPCVLTIAGSDSGGGAGIQMDLRTITALGGHGLTAITCLTAQNPAEVRGVVPTPASFLCTQLETLRDGFRIRTMKTGMLYAEDLIAEVAAFAQSHPDIPLVVDPVMVATSGAVLLQPKAINALTRQLLPRAHVVTPNLDEVGVLLGRKPENEKEMAEAGTDLTRRFGVPFLIKGGHLANRTEIVDLLCQPDEEPLAFHGAYLDHLDTHGSGCLLSAALATLLAHGNSIPHAVREAHAFFRRAAVPGQRLGNAVYLAPH